MNNKELHKFYKFLKEFPEHHSLMKNLLLDYLKLRDENEKLLEANLELAKEIDTYEEILSEEKQLVIQ